MVVNRFLMGIILILTTVILVTITLWTSGGAPVVGPFPAVKTSVATGKAKHTNRLDREKSPYLRQHAHNPVDWYPWGVEAFEKARREDKPIFLSIGYSTCHWCHVMARESFENEEIARILNNRFISIKVDREERPDVDRVYMTYVQATTGGGGWPMSVWLTPDLKPFVGGTYFPPEDKWGRPGLKSVLLQIAQAWKENRNQILAAGETTTRQLQQIAAAQQSTSTKIEKSLLDESYQQIKATFEPRFGGFGGAPKFPRPVVYNFMLRYYARTGNKAALEMTLFTLKKMADGGIRDHIGGGFHRYSVDTFWHVPHFEKMLYDQAQLAQSYLEAFQITREPFYAEVAREILDYVLRDMTGQEGQFYAAEDADSPVPGNPSEHSEGAFYVWERQEIIDALGGADAEIFISHYGVKTNGNAPYDPSGEFKNKNILIVRHSMKETAKEFDRSPAEISAILTNSRHKLFKIRAQRPRPHLDDKALTEWNGLMISAFSRAYQILEEPRYLIAATRAAAFIETNLHKAKSGLLFHRYSGGEAAIDGFQVDYAFFIQGLLDLYEATFDIKYLEWAIAYQKTQDALFWDTSGGYFSTTGSDPSILVRIKDDYDGAEPSGNSIAAMNLLRFAQIVDRGEYREKTEKALSLFSGKLRTNPHAMPQMLVALDFHLDMPKQIIIAGRPDAPDTRAMLREVNSRFIPKKILLLADGGPGQKVLSGFTKFFENMRMLDGKATAYVCEGNATCNLPTTDLAETVSLVFPGFPK